MPTTSPPAGPSHPRWSWILASLVALGWGLRAGPFLGPGGVLRPGLDYDEGVHYAASALLARGVLPYHDFVMVHPPGLPLALAPLAGSALDPAVGLAVARVGMTLIGALNVLLVGLVAGRWWGRGAGIAAAACYAVYPEATWVERRVLMEPLLNALLLLALQVGRGRDLARGLGAGALVGAALAVKSWAVLWLAAWVAGLGIRRAAAVVVGAAVFGAALCLPLVLLDPGSFLDQVVRFHLARPPDGSEGLAGRLLDVLDPRHVPITFLAALGVFPAAASGGTRRVVAVAWALLLVAFLAAPAHWSQYNAHLAVPECLLAGLGARSLRLGGLSGAPAVALLLAVPLGFSLVGFLPDASEHLERGREVRAHVPPTSSFFAFEPGDGLLGGRLPDTQGGAPVVVDTYGTMLRDATASGRRYPSVEAAFADPSSQGTVLRRVEASRWLLVDGRARRQLSGPSRERVRELFRPRAGDLWEARP